MGLRLKDKRTRHAEYRACYRCGNVGPTWIAWMRYVVVDSNIESLWPETVYLAVEGVVLCARCFDDGSPYPKL